MIATDAAGNATTLEVAITVTDLDEDITGLRKVGNAISIYPNPVRNQFSLEGVELDSNSRIRLLTLDGRLAKEFHFRKDHIYDVKDLNAGTYIIVLQGDSIHQTLGKIIKEN
ncbi:hypothetical protein IMPERIA89_460102 [Imperialibacter sp. 89]|nr:hypothetical protein IMPERIA75_340163 [Imperialibacter sp. 75]CAD5280769.1 hypothetical protein IMPERIA89_460102 [Imperialibacter sp. 89]